MFRQVSFNFFRRYLRSYSSASSSDNKKNWNLVASVCLLRKPLINKDMTDLERRVQELLFRIEEERSWKNDWELQTDIDAQDLQKIKSGKSSKIGRKLCRDWEDEYKAEFNSFKLQSCLTEDDKKHNMKSWNRLLDRTLTLIVQPTDRDNVWFLPQSNRQEGENMREAAERVLRECCGENLKAQFYGNAPCGFYKFKFPKALREKTGIEGEKVFFYKAYLLGGTLKSSPVLRDFKWVAQNELGPSLTSEKYCNSVQRFLFNET